MAKRRDPPPNPLRPLDGRWYFVAETDHAAELLEQRDFRCALEIYAHDSLIRAELEARILADQPAADIVAAMSLSLTVVKLYEYWFFDVRRWLRSEAISIICQAIGWPPSGTLRARDVAALWKDLAFNGGLPVFENVFNAVPRSLLTAGVKTYLRPDVPLDAAAKELIAVYLLPIPTTTAGLLRLERLRKKFERQDAKEKRENLGPLAAGLKEFAAVYGDLLT